MKLLCYGEANHERSALPDDGGSLRDLSGHVPDVGGAAHLPASVARLRTLDSRLLPKK